MSGTRRRLVSVLVVVVATGGLLLGVQSPASAAVGDITSYSDPAADVHQNYDITAGPDGNMWFTSINNPTGVGRIDPDTGAITVYRDPTKIGSLRGITTGPDGNIWFITYFDLFGEAGSFVGRIDPDDGAITTFEDPVSLAGDDITTGPTATSGSPPSVTASSASIPTTVRSRTTPMPTSRARRGS